MECVAAEPLILHLRIPANLAARVDSYCMERGCRSRADGLRMLLSAALDVYERERSEREMREGNAALLAARVAALTPKPRKPKGKPHVPPWIEAERAAAAGEPSSDAAPE